MSKPCRYWPSGTCLKGDACRFLHAPAVEEKKPSPSLGPEEKRTIPPFPAYLGRPTNLCGYYHSEHSGRPGIFTFRTVWEAHGLAKYLRDVKYRIVISIGGVDVDDFTTIVTPKDARIEEVEKRYAVKRAFFEEIDESAIWKEGWAERLVNAALPRPSEKHFLIMARALKGPFGGRALL